MNLLHLAQWLDTTTIGNIIKESTYIFPVIEVVHLFGLTLLLGTIDDHRPANARHRDAPAIHLGSGHAVGTLTRSGPRS